MTPFDFNPRIHNDFASRRTNMSHDGSTYQRSRHVTGFAEAMAVGVLIAVFLGAVYLLCVAAGG